MVGKMYSTVGIANRQQIADAVARRPLVLWIVLVCTAGIPRILGAVWLPNAFWDAYSYIASIEHLSNRMAEGILSIRDLYGFWLPLYSLFCAGINVFIDQPFYIAKLASAVCGIGVCVLVFYISLRLTGHLLLSLLAFVLIALNPSHILYSSSALTDIPHAFFTLISLLFVIQKRWLVAAGFAAIAGLLRIEGWIFIVLLPLLQFLDRRRISPLVVVLLLLPALLWLYICFEATGNPLAYFEARSLYIRQYVASNPELTGFSLLRIAGDISTLLNSSHPAVMAGCIAGAWLIARRVVNSQYSISGDLFAAATAAAYFFASLGFLLAAYCTGKQPDIWHRYGLILFALGIPVLAWTFFVAVQEYPHLLRRLSITILLVCLLQAGYQAVYTAGFVSRVSAQRIVADYLRDRHRANPDLRVFCDDYTVRALSGIRPKKFIVSSDVHSGRGLFLTQLRNKGVEYLVYVDEGGEPVPERLFPGPDREIDNAVFRPVMHVRSAFWYTEVWLYRLQYGRVSGDGSN